MKFCCQVLCDHRNVSWHSGSDESEVCSEIQTASQRIRWKLDSAASDLFSLSHAFSILRCKASCHLARLVCEISTVQTRTSCLLTEDIQPAARSLGLILTHSCLKCCSLFPSPGCQYAGSSLRQEDENSSPAVAEQTTSCCCQGNDESAESCSTTQGQGGEAWKDLSWSWWRSLQPAEICMSL